jgi:hypothetical protein
MLPIHPRSAVIWLLGMLAAGALTVLATHALRQEPAAGADDQPQAASLATQPQAPEAPLPPPQDTDARLREALRGLTPRTLFQDWLGHDELLDRVVVTAVNLAEDTKPARLSFLQPDRPFATSRVGPNLVMAERSASRYDAFVNVVSSLDGREVAAAYRTLKPLLDGAYHLLGYPGRSFDEPARRALQRIVDAPVRDRVVVERSGARWVFADASLEALGPVEKQLLRMGARNTRLLQDEAREVASALGFHLRGAAAANAR